MNSLQIFKNKEFGEIRSVIKNNEILFVAADVCKALDLSNPSKAVSRLDDDERANLKLGRQGNTNVVNEYGLYNLVLASRKPEAKAFKRWITHEVIPSLRKTGGYNVSFFKEKEIEAKLNNSRARLNNSRARMAALILKCADNTKSETYKEICNKNAVDVLAGREVVPMLEGQKKTLSAAELGEKLGISGAMVGRIANKYNLKTDQYGQWFHTTCKNNAKREVDTFRYYECAIAKFREILKGGAAA